MEEGEVRADEGERDEDEDEIEDEEYETPDDFCAITGVEHSYEVKIGLTIDVTIVLCIDIFETIAE